MSAKVEPLAATGRHVASFVLSVVLALAVGATAGSLVTRAVTSDTRTADHVIGIAPWDQQKLDAMDGRQKAAAAEAAPGIVPWDDEKLDAMDGFQASADGASSG
jgi:hypothetical protein